MSQEIKDYDQWQSDLAHHYYLHKDRDYIYNELENCDLPEEERRKLRDHIVRLMSKVDREHIEVGNKWPELGLGILLLVMAFGIHLMGDGMVSYTIERVKYVVFAAGGYFTYRGWSKVTGDYEMEESKRPRKKSKFNRF